MKNTYFLHINQSQAKKDGFWSDKKPYIGAAEKEEGEQEQVEQMEDVEAGDGAQVAQRVEVEDITPKRQGEVRPRVVTFQEPGDDHGKE